MSEKWYDKSAVQTATLLGTNAGTGLDRNEVRRRRKLDGENDIYPTPKKNYKTYLAHLLTDFNSLLMLTVLLIAAIFEETENLYVMLAVLLTYYTVAMVTYMKSQNVLDDMGKGALPNAKVLREGRVYMIKQRRLVRGDIIYISAGDIVPCDARIVGSSDLEVLEVNVTGVTHAVRKSARFEEYHDIAPAGQKNMLFASSIVTKGNAKAICCEIGSDTLVCKMKKNNPIVSHERLQVFDRIAVFCRRWTLAMTTIVFVLTVMSLLVEKTNNGIFPSFMTGVSLAVSSMSEFYTAFGYIVLACGIFGALNRKKEVNRGALIKNSSKLEDIKNLTCIMVPKEGAFNIRGMSLEKVFANGDVYSQEDRGFKKNAARVLRYALISTGKYGAGMLTRNNVLGENIYTSEEDAIIKAAEGLSEYNIGLERRYPMVEHVDRGTRGSAFDTTLVHYENGFFVSLRGDYSSILPLCRYYTEDSRVYTMTDEKRSNFYIEAEKLARQSYRVIAIASKDTVYNNLRRVSNCHTELTLEGFLAIREPILPDAAKNVLRCKNAGIKVIMLSPDESENNAVLAESLGIASSPDQLVTGRVLSGMKEGLIRADLDRFTVYQGLTLAQKRMIVRYLQEKGEKVGYLCSELDEIILMKDADVGFAQSVTLSDRTGGSGVDLSRHNIPIYSKNASMGQTGCEALKFVSDVIISEPDSSGTGGFNAIVDAFLCSKSVYYNLYRMLKYTISAQIARLILVFMSMLLGFTALIPSQILFLGLVTDFAAIIIIAFEKPDYSLVKASSNVAGRLHNPFIKNPETALMGALWAVSTAVSAMILTHTSVIPDTALTVYCFVSFIISQIAMLNECKREQSVFDKNVRVNGAYLSMLAVVTVFLTAAFAIPSFGELFGITRISPCAAIAMFIPAVILTAVYEIFKAVTRPKSDANGAKQ